MSSKNQGSSRQQAQFQLGISASNAKTLTDQGTASGSRRGKTYGPDSYRLATTAEESQLKKTAEASVEKRQHVTDSIADSYRKTSN
ncbi:hypothetical protein J3458_009312 [Metarhizium acridum]|uniref:uncharacterized protein n=1 Tax=Metarhizium acridum TaxID=92637 RepID=UPI001C6CCF7A|nr:hypothetical protein J3458_009312 [Metarhizium acridum]